MTQCLANKKVNMADIIFHPNLQSVVDICNELNTRENTGGVYARINRLIK